MGLGLGFITSDPHNSRLRSRAWRCLWPGRFLPAPQQKQVIASSGVMTPGSRGPTIDFQFRQHSLREIAIVARVARIKRSTRSNTPEPCGFDP